MSSAMVNKKSSSSKYEQGQVGLIQLSEVSSKCRIQQATRGLQLKRPLNKLMNATERRREGDTYIPRYLSSMLCAFMNFEAFPQ